MPAFLLWHINSKSLKTDVAIEEKNERDDTDD